jgi:hypothetical protein
MKRTSSSWLSAPGAAGGSRYHAPGLEEPLPAVDERLVVPETRQEMLGGRALIAQPAHPPHAKRHAELGYLVRAHVAPGYIVAVDMLTRTDEESDYAADVSVFSDRLDSETGGRMLEELAFEITDKQRLKVPTEKARRLVARGVRRVFCVLVKQRRMMEWAHAAGDWAVMAADATIDDRCLVRPLPIRSLLDVAAADAAVAAALLARRTPLLEQALATSRAEGELEGKLEGTLEGKLEGLRAGCLAAIRARTGTLPKGTQKRVAAIADARQLETLLGRIVAATDAAAVKALLAPSNRRH